MPVYLRPTTLKAALAALSEASPAAKGRGAARLTILAGATDIYPARAARQAWLQAFPRDFLDITRIPELRGIRRDGNAFVIGAATTWSDVIAADLPPVFEGLKQAARQVGGVQIQNRGTLGGNIANASPAADGVPPLMSLDASLQIASARGERRVPLASFIHGNRRTDLAPDEIVTAIRVPAHRPSARALFLKLGARSHLVISIVSVALLADIDDDGVIADIRVTVGSCSPVPSRLAALEADLRGETLSPDLLERISPAVFAGLVPIDDARGSAAYRRDAARIMVRRALMGVMGSEAGKAAA